MNADLLFIRSGELFPEFLELGFPTYIYAKNILKYYLRKNKNTHLILLEKLKKENYSVIYSNTILSLKLAEKLKNASNELLLHCHESKFLIDFFYEKVNFEKKLEKVDRVIAVSNSVKKTLSVDYNYPLEKIKTIYPFVEIDINTVKKITLAEQNIFKIGVMGNPHLVKGFDLLPYLAEVLLKKYSFYQFKILIIGGNHETNELSKKIKTEVKEKGLLSYFEFIDSVKNPSDYLNSFDVFAMTSRYESFSMVTLEAMLLKKPIVLFRNSGGPEEIIPEEYCFYSNHLDIESMAENIFKIYKNGIKETNYGSNSYQKFDKIKSCEMIVEQIFQEKN